MQKEITANRTANIKLFLKFDFIHDRSRGDYCTTLTALKQSNREPWTVTPDIAPKPLRESKTKTMHLQLLASVLATLATSLLGQKILVDVGENTTLGDRDIAQQLVQFLIVADGKLEVTGNDTGLLVVTGSVTSKLENFSSKVLEDGSEVDGSTGTNALSVVALAEKTVDTANGESETGLGRTATK